MFWFPLVFFTSDSHVNESIGGLIGFAFDECLVERARHLSQVIGSNVDRCQLLCFCFAGHVLAKPFCENTHIVYCRLHGVSSCL